MIYQQLTAQPVCTAAGTLIDVPGKTFENYTVVASALVAESCGRRARLKPGCPSGVQVQVLPSALRGVECP